MGERPLLLLPLLAPTLAAFALDVALRGRALADFRLAGKAIYAGSLLVGAALWFLPSWVAARAWASRRPLVVAGVALVVLPVATLGYAGQALYYDVFHSYVGRDTVRVGLALRATVGGWLFSWGAPSRALGALGAGIGLTAAYLALVRRVARDVRAGTPWLAVVAFLAALGCVVLEGVDSRYLQAATPDVCFVHGAAHALVAALAGDVRARHGMTVRTPAPLPPLASSRVTNVVLVFGESVRADATCSFPPPKCVSPELDAVAADRAPLGRLTTQAPNTFTSSVLLWTGLAPDADVRAAHTAPVLWEVARAAGRRTAYVSAQNAGYDDFAAFVRSAGIDRLVTGTDLGGVAQEQLGAPDERAFAEALRFAREAGGAPYFAVVHTSNTHAPYRVDPALRPFTPDSDDPLGDPERFHNRYRNSIRLEERLLASFLRELRALPSWADTAVIVVADHGEQFFEHGSAYHDHSLYEEELRVPGFLVAGPRALTDAERAALATFAGARTYLVDVHATIVDLLGVDRRALPYDAPSARSLLRPRDADEPFALLSTTSAVWDSDVRLVGALAGDRKAVGPEGGEAASFRCFDVARHPSETTSSDEPWCAPMIARLRAAFASRR